MKEFSIPTKFPYECITSSGTSFVPTIIDYDNSMVWHQKSQASGDGEWIDFDDVIFVKNERFEDLALNKRD